MNGKVDKAMDQGWPKAPQTTFRHSLPGLALWTAKVVSEFMLTNDMAERKPGRPRTLQDDAIFQAVYRVLTRIGPGRLTLAAVAAELDCSAPALLKRFGSKRKLMLASAEWSVRAFRAELQHARQAHASPLAALRTWLLLPTAPGTNQPVGSTGLANALQLYFDEAADPEFQAIWNRWIETYEAGIVQLLDEAVAAGELVDHCDSTRVGRTLHVAMAGAGMLRIGDPRWSTQERSREAFETIVNPWLHK